ncbi:MAG: transcription-repair coupling factor, partial [Bryobacterales bacterium]|nr:transcription-repair coupling factor [Bryobacterales bacterium]
MFHTLGRQQAFQDCLARLTRRETAPLAVSGLTPAAKALYLVLLWQATERPLIVIADGNQRAENLTELIQTFFELLAGKAEAGRPLLLPALDVLPGQKLSPHTEILEQRAIGLWRLAAANPQPPITIAPVGSALLKTNAPDFYRGLALDLRSGDELPLDSVEEHLKSIGYERRDPVEMVGEFSIRGGILDVFGAESPRPLRVEF